MKRIGFDTRLRGIYPALNRREGAADSAQTKQANAVLDRLHSQAVFHCVTFNKLFTSARPNVNDESVAYLSVCGRPDPLRQDPVWTFAARLRVTAVRFIALCDH